MDLPVFEMMINPDESSDIEVMAVALVDKPAIERNFMAFSSQLLYFKADPEKRVISGPAMVPDTLIYRQDQTGEFNVFFSADTIKQIAIKFAAKGYAKQLNLFHDPNLPADGVVIFNSFVSDKSMGIAPMAGFEDLPDGTWFISAKVNNEEIWNKIKAGEVKGFSVEGNFSLVKTGTDAQTSHLEEKTLMSDVKKLLEGFKESFKSFLFDTNIPPTPPAAAPPVPAAQSAVTTKDGVEVSVDKMEVGGVVMIAGAPAPAGELELQDGTKLTIGEGGVISAITPAAAPAPMTPEQQMAAIREAVKKFSAGTPDEKMANHEIVLKALMEYCFGWDLRQAEEKAVRDQAIEVYKTGFEESKVKLSEAQTKIENQGKVIKQLFEIVEKLADTPTGDPASTSNNAFSTSKETGRDERRRQLAESIAKLKKAS